MTADELRTALHALGALGVLAVLGVTLLLAALRFALPSRGLRREDVFKDAAHLWVGGLFGAAIASGAGWLWGAAITLTAVEVVAFLTKRRGP
jgi:hypothetical protein